MWDESGSVRLQVTAHRPEGPHVPPSVLLRGVATLVALLLAGTLTSPGRAGAQEPGGGTEVGGVLASDTTWTRAGSPYRVTSAVQVPAGVTLTVEPGVRVEGRGVDDLVLMHGTVRVEGTASEPVVVDGGGQANVFSAKGARSAVLQVSHAVVQNGRALWPATGHEQNGHITFTDSIVRDLSDYSYLWYLRGQSVFARNVFTRTGGFSVGHHTDGQVSFRDNRFTTASRSGYWIRQWAAYGEPTIVTGNTFQALGSVVLELEDGHPSAELDAPGNYWSTTDPTVVDQMILDSRDSIDRAGRIPYEPLLTAPTSATPAAPVSTYVPLSPVRLLDTRADGPQAGYVGGKPAPGETVELQVTGRGAPLPEDVAAVALNVTAVSGTGHGHVTVWPCGVPRPLAANLNLAPGETAPNLVLAKVGEGGRVCLYTSGGAHLVADVNGFFPAGTDYRAVTPERLLDTRVLGPQTGYTGTRPAAGSTLELQVTGRGLTAVPAGASAAVLNVTGVAADDHGHVTVWPCGEARPSTANLNLAPGGTRPNLVVARLGAGGRVCLSGSTGLDLVADLNGWFPADTDYTGLNPVRLLDTRNQGVPLRAGETRGLFIPGWNTAAGGAPISSAVLNVTGVSATGHGHVTVWPCGTPRPLAANLNLAPGQTAPNLVWTKLGTHGEICLYSSGGTHLVVDVNGHSR